MDLQQHPERLISPRTIRNFKFARSRKFAGPGHSIIEVNLWCERFRFFPKRYREYGVPWWELETTVCKTVNITRWYWLKFGVAFIRQTYT
jgi:hypothetical protein